MKRSREKVVCQCGCDTPAYWSELTEIRVEQATDESARQTHLVKRFWVLRECKAPFEEELALMRNLTLILHVYAKKSFWKRLTRVRQVTRCQHAIYERTHGFKFAHDHAMRSALLFACPRFLQGFLARRFLLKTKRKQLRDATRTPTLTEAKA